VIPGCLSAACARSTNLVLAYPRRKLGFRKILRARSVVKFHESPAEKDAFLPNLVRVCGFVKAWACAIWRLQIELNSESGVLSFILN